MMDTSAWGLALRNIFLPVFCRECGCALLTEENGFFCPSCWTRPERIERPFCMVCGKPHRGQPGFGPTADFPCVECRGARTKPYTRIWAACDYSGAIMESVKLLKFNARPRLAGPLAEEIVRFAEREMDVAAYDAVVPVPLHRVRRRARGFNQSELIAARVLPAFPRARLDCSLQRIRPTRTQSRLTSDKDRRENVRGAFAVDRDRSFAGETVLLLDDVVTTGGTAAECARALQRAGAKRVDVIAAAMPVGRHDFEPKASESGVIDLRYGGSLAATR